MLNKSNAVYIVVRWEIANGMGMSLFNYGSPQGITNASDTANRNSEIVSTLNVK